MLARLLLPRQPTVGPRLSSNVPYPAVGGNDPEPNNQPVPLTAKKSTGTEKRPLASSVEKSRGEATKNARNPSFQNPGGNPAVGCNGKLEQETDLVGTVHESDESHWKRHCGHPSSSTCGRCFYIRHKAELHLDFPWLSERPAHMGGSWCLGCDV